MGVFFSAGMRGDAIKKSTSTTFSTRSSMLLSTPPGRPIAKRAAKKEAEASYVSIRASTFFISALLDRANYLLPFSVAVFVAASHVISVTPRAVARSLIGRNVLPSTTSGEAEAGIAEPLTLITLAPTVIVMIL